CGRGDRREACRLISATEAVITGPPPAGAPPLSRDDRVVSGSCQHNIRNLISMPPPVEARVGLALRRALYPFRQALEVELRPLPWRSACSAASHGASAIGSEVTSNAASRRSEPTFSDVGQLRDLRQPDAVPGGVAESGVDSVGTRLRLLDELDSTLGELLVGR